MGKIIWLASYPKSGNTWVRAFLASYIRDGEDLSMADLNTFAIGDMDRHPYDVCFSAEQQRQFKAMGTGPERLDVHAHIADTVEANPLVKTHGNYRMPACDPAFNLSVTKSIVYVVRNPLDMVVSMSDHYGMTLDRAVEAIQSADFKIGAHDATVEQYLGTWSSHAVNWFTGPTAPRMILRYEDMLRDPMRAFGELVGFLKIGDDPAKLQRAVEKSSFSSLQKKEQEQGFAEKSPNSERFFRKGQSGGWRDILSDAQAKKIVAAHGAVMKKLGYITDNGSIRF